MTCKIQIEIQRPQTRDVHIWNPSCSFPGSVLYSSYLQLSSSQHLCQPLLRFFPGGQEKLWTDISKLDGCTSQGCVSNLKKWKLQGWEVSILSFGSVVCSRFRIGRIDGSHERWEREKREREREGGREVKRCQVILRMFSVSAPQILRCCKSRKTQQWNDDDWMWDK